MYVHCGAEYQVYRILLAGKHWDLLCDYPAGRFLELRENGDTGLRVSLQLHYANEPTAQISSEALLTAYLKQEADPRTSLARYARKTQGGAHK